ncbi:hypothetical protein [Kaarinaea lacus]
MPSSHKSLTLIVPGLLPFATAETQEIKQQLPSLDALSRLLCRAKNRITPIFSTETLLCSEFGLVPQANESLPIAALTYLADKGVMAEKNVIRADPVFLKADRDRLLLLGYKNLDLTLDEAEKIVDEVNRTYNDCEWNMEVGNEDRWYIISGQDFNIDTYPLYDVFGKNIDRYLPHGDNERQWRSVVNELQMLFHNSTVNISREIKHLTPVNSVWIWGQGTLANSVSSTPVQFAQVWSNDALCQGLSNWQGVDHKLLPGTASIWNEQSREGEHLVVLEDLRYLARTDFVSWTQQLRQLEDNWFIPLLYAIKSGDIDSLQIKTPSGCQFYIDKATQRSWWKKSLPWYAVLS